MTEENNGNSIPQPETKPKDHFRSEYRELTPEEVVIIKQAKAQAGVLFDTLIINTPNIDKRCQSLAKTKLEECIMWHTKSVTG